MDYPRPVTDREVEILAFLLSPRDARLEPLRKQVSKAQVTGLCGCGCPSFDLSAD